jgi:regulator of replication initiation timing
MQKIGEKDGKVRMVKPPMEQQHALTDEPKTAVASDNDLDSSPSKNDIEQVRDLLFGEYNREYERQIRALFRQVESMHTNLQRLTEQTERLEREKNKLEERLREYQLRSQVQVDEVQRTFQDRIRQLQREFDIKMDGLLTTIHQMVDDLDGKKMDQQQLAEMMVDLGMRIKRSMQKPILYNTPRLVDGQDDDG